jgi:hypothetical protein
VRDKVLGANTKNKKTTTIAQYYLPTNDDQDDDDDDDGILEFTETSRGGYDMRILMELKVIISQTSSSRGSCS